MQCVNDDDTAAGAPKLGRDPGRARSDGVAKAYSFPAGTIQGDGAAFEPNSPGHIGVWSCRGTHLVAASEIPAAPLWVNTTQLYVIGRQGKEQITTRSGAGHGGPALDSRSGRPEHGRRGASDGVRGLGGTKSSGLDRYAAPYENFVLVAA